MLVVGDNEIGIGRKSAVDELRIVDIFCINLPPLNQSPGWLFF